MGNYEEHTNQNFGSTVFITLFSLFALILFSKSVDQTSSLSRYSLQDEHAFGNISINYDATVFKAVSIPVLYKNWLFAPHNTSLNLFSLQHNITNYNHRTDQNFINIRKTRLLIEPLTLWRIYYLLPLSGKVDLPVLS